MSNQYLLAKNILSIRGWGHFNITEFDVSKISCEFSWKEIFNQVKNMDLFSNMTAYANLNISDKTKKQLGNDSEYGPYLMKYILSEDYELLENDLVEFINEIVEVEFKKTLTILNERKNIEFITDALSNICKIFLNKDDSYYYLNSQKLGEEKLVTSNIWEYFHSIIGVNKRRKVIYLIEFGMD